MNRRTVVTLLAAVIAAAVAIPALADSGPTAQSASVKGLSKRALAKAKVALRKARAAKRQARRARQGAVDAKVTAAKATDDANSAVSLAGTVKGAADAAKISADASQAAVAATRPQSAAAGGTQPTTADEFVALPGGPSVSVTVTSSALVQVWAQAKVSDGGAVSLYEDGQPVRGQAECTGGESDESGVLFASPGGPGDPAGTATLPLATPATLPFCASIGAPGPVLFESPPGAHSFELRYAACGCGGGTATFAERRLIVEPLP